MNIDYAKIIEAANARKEALQKVEALLTEAPIYATHLKEVLDWTMKLNDAFARVDKEGYGLLSRHARAALERLGYTVDYLSDALNTNPTKNPSAVNFGLEHLL